MLAVSLPIIFWIPNSWSIKWLFLPSRLEHVNVYVMVNVITSVMRVTVHAPSINNVTITHTCSRVVRLFSVVEQFINYEFQEFLQMSKHPEQ